MHISSVDKKLNLHLLINSIFFLTGLNINSILIPAFAQWGQRAMCDERWLPLSNITNLPQLMDYYTPSILLKPAILALVMKRS
jgi:hypothetical protein